MTVPDQTRELDSFETALLAELKTAVRSNSEGRDARAPRIAQPA